MIRRGTLASAGPAAMVGISVVLAAIGAWTGGGAVAADTGAFEGPVKRADCGPGSRPETALQGQVPKAERDSGRSKEGYECNLELLGQYQGEGSSWVSQSYGKCAYLSVRQPSQARSPGVQVVDVSDPRAPKLAGTLTSPAMLGTWESLKVNSKRGLLAGVSSPMGQGAAFFDVYDLKEDCRKPKLLNSLPVPRLSLPANVGGHEGNWAPDGKTYWSTFYTAGGITAIDVTTPSLPRVLFTGTTGFANHGFGLSADGNRLYLAQAGGLWSSIYGVPKSLEPNGLQVLDVSEIQARRPAPQMREVSTLHWEDGAIGQHTLPITYGGTPYIVYVDEYAQGAARIIDVSDETKPRIVSKLKLEIHMPEHAEAYEADTATNGFFGYEAHYCEVDRPNDPTALACGYLQSGVRVFDIREPRKPREVAYFNPPAQVGRNDELQNSEHPFYTIGQTTDLTADWCSSPPRFVGDQLWVACQDNGFLSLRFTNGAWPFPERGETGTRAALGLPAAGACTSRRAFTIRLPRGLRSARVQVGGRQAKVHRRGGRLVARVDLRGRARGTVRVRIVARTTLGGTVERSRRYRTCGP